MESAAAFHHNQKLKLSLKPIKKIVETRRNAEEQQSTARATDPINFHDISYVMDYHQWLESKIDPSLTLAVKGPISQLSYTIEKRDEDDEVVTFTRPFTSPANARIPQSYIARFFIWLL